MNENITSQYVFLAGLFEKKLKIILAHLVVQIEEAVALSVLISPIGSCWSAEIRRRDVGGYLSATALHTFIYLNL